MQYHQIIHYYPKIFIFAFLGALLGGFVVRRLALWLGLMDVPNARKMHTRPVALGGGVAIYFAFAFSVYMTNYYSRPLQGIALGGLLTLLIGFVDDWRGGISAVFKFFVLVGLTLVLTLPPFHIILKMTKFYPIDAGLTVLWVVGITSALNAVDNMDGLAAGLSAIAAGAFTIVAIETGDLFMGMLSLGLMGACLGFLPHNFSKKGKIFMGDAGSFTLGYLLAAISILGNWSESKVVAVTIPVLILAVPIFDLTYVVLYRHFTGVTKSFKEALTHCAKDHLSHRLVALGATPRQAVVFIYFIAICLALGGVILRSNTVIITSSLQIIQTLMILSIIVLLMRQSLLREKEIYSKANGQNPGLKKDYSSPPPPSGS